MQVICKCGRKFNTKSSRRKYCYDCSVKIRKEWMQEYKKEHKEKFGKVKHGFSRMNNVNYSEVIEWCKVQTEGFSFPDLQDFMIEKRWFSNAESIIQTLESKGYMFSEDDNFHLFYYGYFPKESKAAPIEEKEHDELHNIMGDHAGIIGINRKLGGRVIA